MRSGEVWNLPLLSLSALLRAEQLSPVEVTEALIARTEALEPGLRSYVTFTPEVALEQARQAEQEIRRGQHRGPLHGVPIALKDIIETKGIRTSAGTKVLAAHVPNENATVVDRLRQAGAVLMGKLTLTEGAFAEHHPEVDVPVNPWNAAHWTGVSSSGSGVAVSAGLCYGTLATDTGGSIRTPSAACGITGLKPTWGRVSRHGVVPLAPSLDHIGPMARSAGDCAAILAAVAGWDPRDPTSSRAGVPDYVGGLERPVQGIRVGVDRGYALANTDAAVAASFDRALDVLRALGAEIREIRLPSTDFLVRHWMEACAVEAVLAHERFFTTNAADYGPALRGLLELGGAVPAPAYARIQLDRIEFCAQLAAVFEDVELIASPALPMTTPSLERVAAITSEPEVVLQLLQFTAPWDFSGSPTLSLPCGFDEAGLPLGFQLIGPQLGEALLLRTGAAFQRATDWHTHDPPF